MIYIFPYNKASASVWALQQALDARIIKLENSKFKWTPGKSVINWGHSKPRGPCLNFNSRIATNKLKTFKILKEHDVDIPKFTTSLAEAQQWLSEHEVLARTTVTGSEGEGIVFLSDHRDTQAPLYVEYVKKTAEYRVHVAFGQAIHSATKLRRMGGPPAKIRNTQNGYIFAPTRPAPEAACGLGVRAVQALGLDFGAVDIIYNQHRGRYYVLEVNTAPGIEGSTIQAYAQAFRNHFHGA